MKKKTIQRLSLHKTTITNLSATSQQRIKGGTWVTCERSQCGTCYTEPCTVERCRTWYTDCCGEE
jgi:hypothetical protein